MVRHLPRLGAPRLLYHCGDGNPIVVKFQNFVFSVDCEWFQHLCRAKSGFHFLDMLFTRRIFYFINET